MAQMGAARLLTSASRTWSRDVRTQLGSKSIIRAFLRPALGCSLRATEIPSKRSEKRSLHTSNARGNQEAEPSHPDEPSSTVDAQSWKDWDVKLEGEGDVPQRGMITLVCPDREKLVLNKQWLRDACECSLCVDPHSGQKNFGTTEIPAFLDVQVCKRSKEGGLEVVWNDDFLFQGASHTSQYPASFIDALFISHTRRKIGSAEPKRAWQKSWGRSEFEKRQIVTDYKDWMSGGEDFVRAMAQLAAYGLVFLRNVPLSEDSVMHVANQIGNLEETFYGRTWDVRSKPQAENVAYTNSFLGLHQDLLYMQTPPRIQLLHCLENSCDGGASIFSDGFRAAQIITERYGPNPNPLNSKGVTYQYNKHGHFYRRTHPVIPPSDNGEIHPIVWWSPPFQSSVQSIKKTTKGSWQYKQWLTAAKQFRQLLDHKTAVFEYKMKPGDCVLFNNWRVLHGRRAFNNSSGSRWLKGAYIENQVYRSKTYGLSSQMSGYQDLFPEQARAGTQWMPMSMEKFEPSE